MLQYVEIRDLAVVEHLKVEFDDGLNVITGETGAGKSIFIRALALLAGAKADRETVRAGAPSAHLSALFDCSKSLEAYLAEQQISVVDGQLVIKRVISAKGRSQCWLNEQLVSTEFLRTVSEQMIDVFAQNQGLRILSEDLQRDCIDQYAQIDLTNYETLYHQTKAQLSEILNLAEKYDQLNRDKDYFEYRVKEFDSLEFSQDHYEKLLEKSTQLKHIHSIKELQNQVAEVLENDFGGDLLRLTQLLKRDRSQIFASQLRKAEDLKRELDELSFSLQVAKSFDESEEEIQKIEEELSLYQRLLRKHDINDIKELEGIFIEFKEKMEFLAGFDFLLIKKLEAFARSVQKCQAEAKLISKKRKMKALDLAKLITNELKLMAIEDSAIEFQLSAFEPSIDFESDCLKKHADFIKQIQNFHTLKAHGQDRIECMFSANKGERLLPLAKVASGGELSRIMLAMKKVLSVGADSCLLVFDEIDTGISGKVASLVGKSLKDLSRRFQVICITHLAQVAAFAEQHFKVEKIKIKDRVSSHIRRLNEKESTDELAQMISATAVTKESRAHAQKLKNQNLDGV
jgi:DNA repair protein RecN (Recombination protein N)